MSQHGRLPLRSEGGLTRRQASRVRRIVQQGPVAAAAIDGVEPEAESRLLQRAAVRLGVSQWREICRAWADPAMDAILSLMESAQSEKVRLEAAQYVVDRGYGKPHQAVHITNEYAQLSDGELADRARLVAGEIARAMAELGDREDGDDGTRQADGRPGGCPEGTGGGDEEEGRAPSVSVPGRVGVPDDGLLD